MSGRGLLDADMATLGRMAGTGLQWWMDELRAMLPAGMRGLGAGGGGPVALFRPQRPIVIQHGRNAEEALPGGRARTLDLALPASLSLRRTLDLPAMRPEDLRAYVQAEAERLFPLGADTLLVDAIAGPRTGDGRMTAEVAAIDRALAMQAIDAASAVGIAPARLALSEDDAPDRRRFDFAPTLRSEGLLPPRSQQKAFWWGLVAFAFLINVGLLIWRDQQQTEALRALVAEQQPAVSVYRVIAGRGRLAATVARTSLARRAAHPALADLAATTAALPGEAWVQRYAWDGRSLRLNGLMRPPIDVVAALRREPRFVNVRTSTGDVQADILVGRPFDVTADIRRPR